MHPQPSRRDSFRYAALSALGAGSFTNAATPVNPRAVAAVITEYRTRSHADVILGKILEGWKQDGGPGPALKLVSLYVDQFPNNDRSRTLAKKHGFPIFDTIEKAVTVGGKSIPVDGVISIGEHGDYPTNDKGQKLHPRRRFFEAITDTFMKYDRVVPVFSDKHLGPVWVDALWMYERAKAMKVPFMAGSSLPLAFRDPELSIPMNSEIESAVGIGYDGLDIYGSHALDCYQGMVERRAGSEKGVKWVQGVSGEAMWKAIDSGAIAKDVLDAALAVLPGHKAGDIRKDPKSTLFLFQYEDGFQGAVLMLPAFVGGTSVAVKLKGKPKPLATRYEERTEPHFPHFAFLLKAIERMIHTGKPSYPIEHVLLTSGILDRAITSLFDGQNRLNTPELAIAYTPVDYPHAPKPDLMSDSTK